MAVYAITGKLGSGKGKGAIQRLREYLRKGKRVATNCDTFLEHLMPALSKDVVLRIPDKPNISDLYAIGSGNRFIHFDVVGKHTNTGYEFTPPKPVLLDGFDECHNGALILDECASWLNTRNFQDKGRAALLEWAIHARKYGWDVYFVCQDIKQIDAQLRDSLFEYVVRMSRLDRMKIPFISSGLKFLTAGHSDGSLPRMHIGVVRLGTNPQGLVADRWVFRGDDINAGYNTTQVFSDAYPHAIHSVLSSWHLSAVVGLPADFSGPTRPNRQDEVLLKSRPLPPKPPHKHMTKFLTISLLLGTVLGAFAYSVFQPKFANSNSDTSAKEHKYDDKLKGVGFFINNHQVTILLSDGRYLIPMNFIRLSDGWEAQISKNVWVKGGIQ
jgi:hypothetical protein